LGQDIQFTDLEELPIAKSAISSASNSEYIFIANGFSSEDPYTTEIFQYDINNDSWSTLTSSTITKRYASIALIDDFLYVFNGVSNGIINSAVEKININDGSIELLNANPHPSRAAGVTVWNNKIYSFGGFIDTNEYSDKLYEYDPQSDTWTEIADIIFAGETKGEIIDGKLYVFGGYNGSVSDRIDIYDIPSGTWLESFTMPQGISAHATAIIGSKIYLIGDFLNLKSVTFFDTTDNTFQTLDSNITERRHCAAEGVNGVLYAIGGNTESNIQSSIASVQKSVIQTGLSKIHSIENFKVYPNPEQS